MYLNPLKNSIYCHFFVVTSVCLLRFYVTDKCMFSKIWGNDEVLKSFSYHKSKSVQCI